MMLGNSFAFLTKDAVKAWNNQVGINQRGEEVLELLFQMVSPCSQYGAVEVIKRMRRAYQEKYGDGVIGNE